MVDWNLLATQLLDPNLWWLWEACVIGIYFLFHGTRGMGKTLVIPMRMIGSNWFAGRPKFVNPSKNGGVWRRSKGEAHRLETDKTAFIQTGFVSYPVMFMNAKRTRPMVTSFQELEHGGKKKNGGTTSNPGSDDFDQFAVEKAYEQAKRSNRTGKPDYAMVIMAAIAAAAVAAFATYLLAPPHYIPVNVPVNATQIGGAITRTITHT